MDYKMITAMEAKELIKAHVTGEQENIIVTKMDLIQEKIKRAIEDGDTCIVHKVDTRVLLGRNIVKFLKQCNFKVDQINIPAGYGYILISWS